MKSPNFQGHILAAGFFFIGLMLNGFAGVLAQCDDCKQASDFSSDFCYTDSLFITFCAQFSAEKDYFVLQHGKKSKDVPVLNNPEMNDLLALVNNRKLKISAAEILFIQNAFKAWTIAKRDIGLVYTASGLGYKIIKAGEGPLPQKGQTVEVNYRGMLADGTVFDDSWKRGAPIEFQVGTGRVIKGWDEGIALLKTGTRALLKIPPELGYGSRGAGSAIPPNATLYFEVEILGVE